MIRNDGIKISLDVMSGELGPEEFMIGVMEALKEEEGFEVILVGANEVLEDLLEKRGGGFLEGRVRVVDAKEVIGMGEKNPAKACRWKEDSSVMVASRLVREGEAEGFFSLGNTGATLAASMLNMKRLKGVIRPALMAILPTLKLDTILIDVGANVDCGAKVLCQFGLMGQIFSRLILSRSDPKVGLLNIGEEDQKGNEIVQKAYELMRGMDFNFVGNVEGNDLYKGDFDVVVCDGFIGNIVLKLSEGLGSMVFQSIKNVIVQNFRYRLGAYMSKGALLEVKRKYSSESYGGALLLGVDGYVVVGHGKGGRMATKNAILMLVRMIRLGSDFGLKTDIETNIWNDSS